MREKQRFSRTSFAKGYRYDTSDNFLSRSGEFLPQGPEQRLMKALPGPSSATDSYCQRLDRDSPRHCDAHSRSPERIEVCCSRYSRSRRLQESVGSTAAHLRLRATGDPHLHESEVLPCLQTVTCGRCRR